MAKATKLIKANGKTGLRVNADSIEVDKHTFTPVASGMFERKKISYTATAFVNAKRDGRLILVYAPVIKSANNKWQAEHDKTHAFWFVQDGPMYFLDDKQHEKGPFGALKLEKAVKLSENSQLSPGMTLFDKLYHVE
jgi:hypothetical protein